MSSAGSDEGKVGPPNRRTPTARDRPREDVVREVMQLLAQLEAAFNQLPSPENGELVDFVNILRCRLGQRGPRLIGVKKGKYSWPN